MNNCEAAVGPLPARERTVSALRDDVRLQPESRNSLSCGRLRPSGQIALPGDGGPWLIVTTVVSDPVYLTTELVMSTQFKKETGRGGWRPRPCEIAPPLVATAPPA